MGETRVGTSGWAATGDVFVYFDDDAKVMAPRDAMALARKVE